jgi:hypothetical protein
VRCGNDVCDLAQGEVCCTSSTGIGGTRTACARNTSSCTRAFACDNPGDCGVGEQCCMTYGLGSLSPSTACVAGSCEIPVECGSSADCGSGQLCCGDGSTVVGGTRYSALRCQSEECNGGGDYTLCHGGTVCPGGTSCEPSSHFPPGYPVCK